MQTWSDAFKICSLHVGESVNTILVLGGYWQLESQFKCCGLSILAVRASVRIDSVVALCPLPTNRLCTALGHAALLVCVWVGFWGDRVAYTVQGMNVAVHTMHERLSSVWTVQLLIISAPFTAAGA